MRDSYSGSMSVCRSDPDSGTLHTSYGMAGSTCPRRFPIRQCRRVLFLMGLLSLYFAQIVNVAFINVVGNASLTVVLSRGIDLEPVVIDWGGISHGVKS